MALKHVTMSIWKGTLMSKKQKNRILFIIAILTFFIGCIPLTVPSLKSENSGLITISIWCLSAVILSFWALEAHEDEYAKKQRGIKKGNVPLFESNCTHISGLASFTAEGTIKIYVDRIHFTVAGTHYELPIERIRSADILTQKQTDTVLNENFGRTLLATLLFGELGALISIERSFKEKEITITEENLVITYEKDGEAKFIVLKNLPCDKVIRELEKLVTLTPRQVQL